MAAKDQVQRYPLAPSSIMPRSDAEYANNYQSNHQMNKKKRIKCFSFIAILSILIIAILTVALIFIRAKTPKVTLEDVVVTPNNLSAGDLSFAARVVIKNRSFGRYKFDSSYAIVRAGNSNVGQFVIDEGRARARSTKKRAVVWDVRSANGSSSGSLDLVIRARLRGKVEVLRVFRRRKSADMSCTLAVDLASSVVRDLRCNS